MLVLQILPFAARNDEQGKLQNFVRHKFPGPKLGSGGDRNLFRWLLFTGASPAKAQGNFDYTAIPSGYPRLEEIFEKLTQLAAKHPDLVDLETIGESSVLHLPIYALKISDNAAHAEDESAVLFSGLHHAREPLGALACLYIMDELLAQYETDPEIRRVVDTLQIWFVPVVNPDGYKYMMDNHLVFPWWRKNLRDNNKDGAFDPIIDGVDLNRNYDFNWRNGGEGNPVSWFFRGQAPFSESESVAIRDLALRENFVAGISFHTYGESVLYPWANFSSPPDQRLIVGIAQKIAGAMKKHLRTGPYSIIPLDGRAGQSSVWMYGRLRAIDFIVELGDDYLPQARVVPLVLSEALQGAFVLLHEATTTGIRGHVLDRQTGAPVVATILIDGLESDFVSARKSESRFGRFERMLQPGTYSETIEAEGYQTVVLTGVNVVAGKMVEQQINLSRAISSLPTSNN